jgi:phage-related protein
MEEGSPLACARAIAKVHGGDLVFDNNARTVFLLTFAGKDLGVAWFYGRSLTSSARLEDTTSLVTRLVCRNADGQTIAPDNRNVYTLAVEVDSSGGPDGWVPDLEAVAEIAYDDDDTTETATFALAWQEARRCPD